ncbi:MAG: phosphoribosyltransferase [Flavobacteriaceae bacterium]|nr:phosphoribosyltransferase domain-containing protein [Bacteroidia bacterium]NNK87622.1 phosphoribosyltransferase [Flavobacteriaceae bacterium]
MTQDSNIILNDKQIKYKIRRIAYQIYECNVEEEEIILAGIADNGYEFAKKLKTVLSRITGKQITLCKVIIDKRKPQETVKTSIRTEDYTDKSVVLVDDVLNSGTTLIYGVKHFLDVPLKQFKTAVLVNRNHKKYPVKADFKGLSLSTSIKEHIRVEINSKESRAILE